MVLTKLVSAWYHISVEGGVFINQKSYTIYAHINNSNGKVYIGQTQQNVNKRWQNGYGYVDNDYFYKAIKKYGWDGFKHIILFENLSPEMADIIEIALIDKYKSNIREFGYNLSGGGNHHKEITDTHRQAIIKSNQTRYISDETKEKLRQKFQGENGYWYGVTQENHPRYGTKMPVEAKNAISAKNKRENWSEETIKNKEESYKKQSERMKGKPLSKLAYEKAAQYHKENPMPQETRNKISKTLKENPYWLGKKMSEESRQKMSKSRKGKFKGGNNPMARAVVQIDKVTEEIIKVYDCAQDVENELGIRRTSVTTCCRGRYKTAGGYIWKYKDELEIKE